METSFQKETSHYILIVYQSQDLCNPLHLTSGRSVNLYEHELKK